MLARKQDWQLHFEKCVSENYNKKFEWGTHDCFLWSANLVLAITGTDIAENLRGTYSTAKDAKHILKEFGGLAGLVTEYTGKEPVSPLLAAVGDLVLTDYTGQHTMAVCNGETLLATGVDGLVSLPMSAALKAWRI